MVSPMKNCRHLLLTTVLLFPTSTLAEVIKWTDEHGRVHYGDKVPEKYKKDSTQLKINTAPATPSKPKKPITGREYFAQQEKRRKEEAKQEEEAKRKYYEQYTAESIKARQEQVIKDREASAKKYQQQNAEQDPCITNPQPCLDRQMRKFEKTQKRIREAAREAYLRR